ncbi:hypothetical protein LSAT2_000300, partial [Lamellibrachia satsuma]
MSPNLLAVTQHRDGLTEECTSKPMSCARLERIHRKMYVQPSHSLLRILVICACSWTVSISDIGHQLQHRFYVKSCCPWSKVQ